MFELQRVCIFNDQMVMFFSSSVLLDFGLTCERIVAKIRSRQSQSPSDVWRCVLFFVFTLRQITWQQVMLSNSLNTELFDRMQSHQMKNIKRKNEDRIRTNDEYNHSLALTNDF